MFVRVLVIVAVVMVIFVLVVVVVLMVVFVLVDVLVLGLVLVLVALLVRVLVCVLMLVGVLVVVGVVLVFVMRMRERAPPSRVTIRQLKCSGRRLLFYTLHKIFSLLVKDFVIVHVRGEFG